MQKDEETALSLSACPRLEKVELSLELSEDLQSKLIATLPGTLRRFTGDGYIIHPAVILQLLFRRRNLEELRTMAYGEEDLPPVHARLRPLSLHFDTIGYQPLFQSVRFPSLVHLEIVEITRSGHLALHRGRGAAPDEPRPARMSSVSGGAARV